MESKVQLGAAIRTVVVIAADECGRYIPAGPVGCQSRLSLGGPCIAITSLTIPYEFDSRLAVIVFVHTADYCPCCHCLTSQFDLPIHRGGHHSHLYYDRCAWREIILRKSEKTEKSCGGIGDLVDLIDPIDLIDRGGATDHFRGMAQMVNGVNEVNEVPKSLWKGPGPGRRAARGWSQGC